MENMRFSSSALESGSTGSMGWEASDSTGTMGAERPGEPAARSIFPLLGSSKKTLDECRGHSCAAPHVALIPL
eukprot:4189611-Amphidinium_carterae.1